MREKQESTRFVLVGHCVPDQFLLENAISRHVPQADVIFVNEGEALESYLYDDAVFLVNRELDGDFETSDGIELIKSLASRENPPLMMLISNLEDAQKRAIEEGALPGFGKSALYEETTGDRLRAVASRRVSRGSI